MRIHVTVEDTAFGRNMLLQDCGIVLTDSPARALQMFTEIEQRYTDEGFYAETVYEIVEEHNTNQKGH